MFMLVEKILNIFSFSLSIPLLHEFFIFVLSIIYLMLCIFLVKSPSINLSLIFEYFNFFKKSLIFLMIYTMMSLFYKELMKTGIFFNGYFYNSFSILFFKLILLFFGYIAFTHFFNFIFKFYNFWSTKNTIIYPLLLIGSFFFLLLLVSTYDLFLTCFMMLGMSICLYVILLSFYIYGKLVREASIKYFLFSVLSTGFLFGAVKEFYFCCGTLHFAKLNDFLIFFFFNTCLTFENLFIIKYAMILLLFGFLSKLSAFPTQFWAPEVYEGTSFSILTFIAVPLKFSISVIFFKIFKFIFMIPINNWYINFYLLLEFNIFLKFMIIATICFGGMNAFFEKKMKRFIAYSSINQMGFLSMSILGFNTSFFNLEIFFYFLFTYLLNLIFFLSIINWYSFKLNFFMNTNIMQILNINKFNLIYLSDFKFFFWYFQKIYKYFPILSFISFTFWLSFILTLFSMAGIPPLLGFYGKFYILLYAFKNQNWMIFFIGLIMSMLGAYYYLRMIKITFFEKVLDETFIDIKKIFEKKDMYENKFYLLFWFFLEIKYIYNFKNFLKKMNIICFFYCLMMMNAWFFDIYLLQYIFLIVQNILQY